MQPFLSQLHKFLLLTLTLALSLFTPQLAFTQEPAALSSDIQPENTQQEAPAKKHKPKVGDIHEDEIDRIDRRIKTHSFSTFGFGPYGSATSSKGGVLYGISLGNIWEASEHGEIRWDATLAANGNQQLLNIGLGYGYILFNSTVSPIIGGKLGLGAAGYDSADEQITAAGFSGDLFLGMRFFRTSDTQLEVALQYHAIFAKSVPGFYGIQLKLLY